MLRRLPARRRRSWLLLPLPLLLLLLLLLESAGRGGGGGGGVGGGVQAAEAAQAAAVQQETKGGSSCKLSEYRCVSTGVCLAQDKFCDGENDCGDDDKSDEPVYCTPCNRTLYGDVGRTYQLQIRRPREDKLPFLCHLNFTAAGHDLGDLVQLTFDTFTVGRFLSFTSDGCPDGHMSINEEGRPPTGGKWCGSAWGYTVYYSETRSINLTLYLSQLYGQGNDYNFDFKLSYKFLKRSEAHLRYGNSSVATWRGELVNATYCDRVFTRCDVRPCRVQSPNYPGVYPRNATCYYRIEHRAPPGHRALLAVSQRNSHKIHIKDQPANKYGQRTLRVWDQCNAVQDYLTVYDGGSTTDKVLVRLCGGDNVPEIVSSRDTMLLEFHTSPSDNPFHPVPLAFLPGFELEVQVILVDERAPASFVLKDKETCDFYVTSYDSQSGVLENPRHSLPPNTTCRYHFEGKPNEVVWLAFVKYYTKVADPGADDLTAPECGVKLLIWNGDRDGESDDPVKNATLMGQFCKNEVPRLCDHSLLQQRNGTLRQTRPCSMSESYVSTGRYLTLEHILKNGSALYPVSFVVRYEFVHQATSCDRVFVPGTSNGEFQSFGSPRSVFFYGRGGAANLSCVYSFKAGPDRRLELSITRASFGGRNCRSVMDPLVNRWACEKRRKHDGVAELRLSESPWQGIQLPRDCICSNLSERLVFQSLSSPQLELSFVVTKMNVTQDFLDFYFEGEYRFVPSVLIGPAVPPDLNTQHTSDNKLNRHSNHHNQLHGNQACHGSSHSLLSGTPRMNRLEERRLRGTSGEISLRSPPLSPAAPVTIQNLITSSMTDTRKDRLGGLATIDESIVPLSLSSPDSGSRSGATVQQAAEVTHCVNEPWLIEPEDSTLHFLYLKTPGFRLDRRNVGECRTRNRIIVYPASNTMDRTVVCPAEGNSTRSHSQIVDLISGGWNRTGNIISLESREPLPEHQQQHARSFVIEFLQREPGYYVVSWMAISKRLLASTNDNFFTGALAPSGAECPYRCPELDACISSMLWCDGVRHCPSGFDERDDNCSYRFGVTLLYVAVGAGALGIFLILLLATGCLKYCLYRRRRLRRQNPKKMPPQGNSEEQQRLQKKKVQVLSVNHLDSPDHSSTRNNGNLDTTVGGIPQPRYAAFTRGGGRSHYDSSRFHQHHWQPQLPDELDEEEDEFAEKYTKDSIC